MEIRAARREDLLEVADRRRLGADRFRRIWQLVEHIAREPGLSRRMLAAAYRLSERQIQSDLNVIRKDMGLPLVRRQGYRFLAALPDEAGPPFSLAEAQLLLILLRRASLDPRLPPSRLHSLMGKLPQLFPLHLRPLVEKTLHAVTAGPMDRQHEVFSALADALLRKAWVKLHYAAGEEVSIHEPVVMPEVLFPYVNSWYLIGDCRQRARTMVFELDNVIAVTPASGL